MQELDWERSWKRDHAESSFKEEKKLASLGGRSASSLTLMTTRLPNWDIKVYTTASCQPYSYTLFIHSFHQHTLKRGCWVLTASNCPVSYWFRPRIRRIRRRRWMNQQHKSLQEESTSCCCFNRLDSSIHSSPVGPIYYHLCCFIVSNVVWPFFKNKHYSSRNASTKTIRVDWDVAQLL